MLGSPTDLAPAYLKLIELQAARTGGSEVRMLTVVNDVRAMGEIADIVEETLTVNGRSVADAITAGTYNRIAIESLALTHEPEHEQAFCDRGLQTQRHRHVGRT